MTVITLSREYGAGGLNVGLRVAKLLEIDFLDTALIEEVARRLHVPSDAVERWDERRESLILRLLRSLQASHPEMAAASPVAREAISSQPDPDRIWSAVQEVMREEARTRSAVIVGRGGAFILAGMPGVHHFRLVASHEARVRWLAEAHGLERSEAARRVEAADRARLDFLRHRCGVDPTDAHHFSLVLNTETLGWEKTARIIVRVVSESA